jgi:hypothetical protein
LKSQQNSPKGRNREGWYKIHKLEEIVCLKFHQNSQWRRIGKEFLGTAISPGQK